MFLRELNENVLNKAEDSWMMQALKSEEITNLRFVANNGKHQDRGNWT